MLRGVSIRYAFDRDRFVRGDGPILAAIVRGDPFRIELPKTEMQRFSPASGAAVVHCDDHVLQGDLTPCVR
jgi:hypothetical protein